MLFKIDCFNAGLANNVFELVNPLTKNNIALFNYAYYGSDGSRSELWSNASAFNHVFEKELPIVSFNLPDYFVENETWSLLEYKIEDFPIY